MVTAAALPPADSGRRAPYVIVGGGPAAASATRVLARSGADVVVLTAEPTAPYDRTALSKPHVLADGAEAPPLWHADEEWLDRVLLRRSTVVTAIDVPNRSVATGDGETLAFEALLLCTGAAPRRLALPGEPGAGVHYLRDARDAAALCRDLDAAERVTVIGGGVIGMEVAAAAALHGRQVEVVEAAPRVLGRGVPTPVADWLVTLHESKGVGIRAGTAPSEIVRSAGRVTGVRLQDGSTVAADVVVIGIGVRPRDELAAAAGLEVDDGIVVDPAGRTSVPGVFAAGDVVRQRGTDGSRGVRLESYQPAGRQGEAAALTMLGAPSEPPEVPWSWSDQYDAMLQSAGLAPSGASELQCGTSDAVLVLSFHQERLVAVCGVASGTTIAKPVRTAQLVIAAGGRVDRAALERARHDLGQLTKLLRAAVRTPPG